MTLSDFSIIQNRKILAQQFATSHSLNPAIVAAVCEQESGWEPGAVRFEPAFLKRYIMPLKLANMESLDRSTSYGLMQVMGQVAIELGFGSGDLGKVPLSDLRIPEVGLDYGCRKLRKCFVAHPSDNNAALQMYNGGSNPNYATQVLARTAKYV